jgi:hypothetical protein
VGQELIFKALARLKAEGFTNEKRTSFARVNDGDDGGGGEGEDSCAGAGCIDSDSEGAAASAGVVIVAPEAFAGGKVSVVTGKMVSLGESVLNRTHTASWQRKVVRGVFVEEVTRGRPVKQFQCTVMRIDRLFTYQSFATLLPSFGNIECMRELEHLHL